MLNNEVKKTFKQLKQTFKETPLLAHFNSKAEICVKTDTSAIITVEILIQKLPADIISIN